MTDYAWAPIANAYDYFSISWNSLVFFQYTVAFTHCGFYLITVDIHGFHLSMLCDRFLKHGKQPICYNVTDVMMKKWHVSGQHGVWRCTCVSEITLLLVYQIFCTLQLPSFTQNPACLIGNPVIKSSRMKWRIMVWIKHAVKPILQGFYCFLEFNF